MIAAGQNRKRQHEVGLAMKEEFVKKACKDGNAIECTTARLLKARTRIKSVFVAFVVADAPTEEAPERQKTKYMAALKQQYRSISACSGIRLGFNSRERQDREVRVAGKQEAKCLAHMAEMSSTKTSSEYFLLHPQKWIVLHVPKRKPRQETSTFGLFSDKACGL